MNWETYPTTFRDRYGAFRRVLRATLAHHQLDLVNVQIVRDTEGPMWRVCVRDDGGEGAVWVFDARCQEGHVSYPAIAADVARRVVARWHEKTGLTRKTHWTDRLDPGELALLPHPVRFEDPIAVLLYRLARERALYGSLLRMADGAWTPPSGAPPSPPPPDEAENGPPPCAPDACRWEPCTSPIFDGFLAERCPVCEESRSISPRLSTEVP